MENYPLSDHEIALWILSHGGAVDTISCYDEEGVEGWKWWYEDKEWWDLGDWNSIPPIPKDMLTWFKTKYPKGI